MSFPNSLTFAEHCGRGLVVKINCCISCPDVVSQGLSVCEAGWFVLCRFLETTLVMVVKLHTEFTGSSSGGYSCLDLSM